MPLYLWKATYSAEGTKGLVKEGGSARRAAVQQAIEKVGGKLHSFYYALGEADVVGIAEFPDVATAVALSLAVNSSGVTQLTTTMLITPEEVDAAAKKAVPYRAPGA
jgi:uncharacterized protein with GYD domain